MTVQPTHRRPLRLRALLLFGLAALGAAGPVQAQLNKELKGQDFAVERLRSDIVVHADGSYVQTDELAERLGSERAVHEGAQIKLPFSASLDDLSVIEAYTLKKDGRHVPVPAGSVFQQDGLISAVGVTSFQDIKTKVIVFADAEPGDAIVLRSVLTRKRPMLAGIFTYVRSFPGDVLFRDVAISLSAPASLPMNVESFGVTAQEPVAQNGLRQWRWTYAGGSLQWPEESAVDPMSYRPRIFASTLQGYEQLAAAATPAFQTRMLVTPEVRALAQQITAGAATAQEKALRIHDWVARNIRYFAIVLDVGGYVPRSSGEVLATRYGDCKDHVVLMGALLAAAGIASQPALLTTEPLYELPRTPVMAAFNHVITYVPSLNVFLESTTPWTAYGVLPDSDAGKPVLLLGAASPVSHTPASRSDVDTVTLVTRITVRPDGTASGSDELTATGAEGLDYNALSDWIANQDPLRTAKQFLLHAGLVGDGAAVSTKLSNAGPYRLKLLYELKEFAAFDAAGSVTLRPPLEFFDGTAASVVAQSPVRRTAYVCGAVSKHSVIDIEFPPGTRLMQPKGVSISVGARQYQSVYTVSDNRVHVDRQYVSSFDRNVCPPADFAAAHEVQQAILRDVRRPLLFVPAGPPR